MGVYEIKEHYCDKCKKQTMHDIGWESEFPDQLDLTCTKCGWTRMET